jgi:peptide/nickel transport system ATP-binding protein
MTSQALLDVRGLSVRYRHPQGGRNRWLMPVQDLSFTVNKGDVFCLVGESGSGKTTVARAVMGLAPIFQGSITVLGQPRELAPKSVVQMVFQDPAGSLNPRRPAWWLVTEPAALMNRTANDERRHLALRLLRSVGLDGSQAERLPHQLSGGQRQRLAIARALSTDSSLLVLDEPTSALDVTVQAQVLDLLLELQATLQLSYLLITHNLSVVRHLGTQVAVMQQGRLVEAGSVAQVLDSPAHTFTQRLVGSVPSLRSGRFLENQLGTEEAR